MVEPSRRRRRRSYASESNPPARGPNIHGWISDDGRHAEYLERWKERKQLIEQGVQHLLQLQGHYYPDLVRVFYYNLKTQNGIVYTRVKQMGFIRQGNMFVRAEGDNAQDADESDEEDEVIPVPDPTNVAGPSHPPQEYSLVSISRQIEAMAFMQQTRMDDMMAYHTRRYDEINTHLKEIDDKLAKLYVPDSDDES
ncbi:hypothetical protein LR48_Vigan10g178800 [Vigna angularis]|uniref:Uncharacterized protein n=1 Tax=Phaseolus angularis TaxID=3914 RepID=A0A0L9VLF4_PHAAN|nr:hypothetical protein LR48_Vigan10g178800 [Vigna angularis]